MRSCFHHNTTRATLRAGTMIGCLLAASGCGTAVPGEADKFDDPHGVSEIESALLGTRIGDEPSLPFNMQSESAVGA